MASGTAVDDRPAVGPVRLYLGAALLYLVAVLALTAGAWQAPTTRWIGSCCDPEQSMWFLSWTPAAIADGTNPLVTGQMNAPTGVNLMWNTSMPVISLVLAPVTATAGPVCAYNVAMAGALVLSALACFACLRHIVGGVVGPLVGGAVYGLSPYAVSHAALHLDLVAAWAPPLFLALVHALLVRRRLDPARIGFALGVLAAIQLLTFEEVLATSAVAALVLAVALAAVTRDRGHALETTRRIVRAAVPAAVSFAVLAAVPLWVQFLGPQRITGRVQDVSAYSTDLLNVIVPTRYQLFAPDAATRISKDFSGLYHEATAYLGLPLLLVLVAALVLRWTDLRIRVAGGAAVAMLVLSLGPVLHVGGASTGIPMPWRPVSGLPLLEHALPGRLTVYAWLAIAVILAIVVSDLLARRTIRSGAGLVAVALAIVVAAPAPLTSSTAEIPAFFRAWDRQGIADDAILLIAPHFTDGAGADPMVWAAVAGTRPRLYEAYAFVPDAFGKPRYGPPATQLTAIMEAIQDQGSFIVAGGAVREQVLRDLATAGITDVIVGPMRYRAQMVAFFTDLFDRAPIEVDGVELWRDVTGGAEAAHEQATSHRPRDEKSAGGLAPSRPNRSV